jgi:hypothetical protein
MQCAGSASPNRMRVFKFFKYLIRNYRKIIIDLREVMTGIGYIRTLASRRLVDF